MKSAHLIIARVASVAAIALLAHTASGQTDGATARALFDEARSLVLKQDYAAACPMFEESYRLDPGTGTLLNLADCLEKIGRTASAWARFLEVADMTKRLGQSDRERVARSRAAALEPTLSKLRIEVPSPEAGLELSRDGLVFGKAQWGVDLPIDAGRHTIEAKATDRKPWTSTIEVPPGGQKAVLVVPQLSKADTPQVNRVSTLGTSHAVDKPMVGPSPKQSGTLGREIDRPSNRILGISAPTWIMGGVGAAGLVMGTVFAFEVHSRNGDADAVCPTGHRCSDEEIRQYQRYIDDAKTARWLSAAGFSVGGAALLGGTLMWLMLDRQHTTAGRLVPTIGFDLHSRAPSASLMGAW